VTGSGFRGALVQEIKNSLQRDGQPLQPVGCLVDDLVQGFFQQEELQYPLCLNTVRRSEAEILDFEGEPLHTLSEVISPPPRFSNSTDPAG
jgi:hypothetical protein